MKKKNKNKNKDGSSSFNDIIGDIGADPEMVVSIPKGDLLPEPDLLQEIIALLVKVDCCPRFHQNILLNLGDVGCLAGGECFPGASDVYP